MMESEKSLLEKGYRKYQGEHIDVFYNREICCHSGNCTTGNGNVFKVGRRPWIQADQADASEVIRVIKTCPSGALKYIEK